MLSLTSPVPSFWQRVPTAIKMAGLCLVTLLLFSAGSLWASIPILLFVAGCYLVAGLRFALHGLRMLRPLLPFVVVVTIWHLLTGDPQKAAQLAVRISTAVAAANLVTMTSALSDIVAIIEWLVSPLRVFGVRPRVIGLAVALVIRFIPVTSERVSRLAEAWRARSARRAGWHIIAPATLGALDDAEHVADALRARGGAG